MPENDDPNLSINLQADHAQNPILAGYVGGDLNINAPRRERACPTAPPPPENFTGRVETLDELRRRIQSGEATAITAVQGLGGMGKTALARYFALIATQEMGYQSVLWADVTRNPDPLSLLSNWMQYAVPDFVADSTATPRDLIPQVRAHLTKLLKEECPGRTLVVIDDVWDNGVETAEWLREAAPAGSTVLITTRLADVANKLGCEPIEVRRLSPDEASALLARLVHNKAFTEDHRDRLVKVLGGHPLALKLAAPTVTRALNAERIEQVLGRFEHGLGAGDPFPEMQLGTTAEEAKDEQSARDKSLLFSFRMSYEALTPDMQRRFRALGVLAPDAPWPIGLVTALWYQKKEEGEEATEEADTEKETEVAASALETLLSAYLVEPTPRPDYPEGWYEQHPLLRAYALALLR